MTPLTFALIVAAGVAVGVAAGRAWQRHEHAPHWDEMARRDAKEARLRHRVAELERSLAAVKLQRDRAMEAYRRLRDRGSV